MNLTNYQCGFKYITILFEKYEIQTYSYYIDICTLSPKLGFCSNRQEKKEYRPRLKVRPASQNICLL